MGTNYRNYSPDQMHLLPPSPQDWLPEGHLVYQVHDVVQALDLGAIYRAHAKDPRGAPGFHPLMMVSILIYAWANRVYSSRRISRLCLEDLGGRYLSAGHHPDFRTISLFQLTHGESLADLFVQSVHLCQRAGMVGLNVVAVDGSKVEANASKHQAMSYGRMNEKEEQLRQEIVKLQHRGQQQDADEDLLFGKDKAGFDLPAELKRHETRLAHILSAKKALEAEAVEAALAAEAARKAKECEQQKPIRGRKPKPPIEAKPKDKAQRNFTDPESRIMKAASGAFIQGYNGQAAVDDTHQVIVACELTNQASDSPHFIPVLEQVQKNTGEAPQKVVADAGYFSETNIEHDLSKRTRFYVSPSRLKHGSGEMPDAPTGQAQTKAQRLADEMRLLLRTKDGHDVYAKRKKIVEPVFGQIKGCPGSPGFTHFLRRGLEKARQEWQWACATHNLLKYLRHQCAATPA